MCDMSIIICAKAIEGKIVLAIVTNNVNGIKLFPLGSRPLHPDELSLTFRCKKSKRA